MASGFLGALLGPQRRARFLAGHLTDVLVVAVLAVLVVAVSRPAVVDGRIDLSDATAVLTLVAAAVGSAAAIVALVTGRLSGDPRPSWFGAALLLYGVVLLPLSALVLPQYPAGTPRLAVLTMFVISLCILVAALRPPPALGAWGGWALAAVALVIGGVVASQAESPFTRMVATSPLYSIVVQSGWALVAVLFMGGWQVPAFTENALVLGAAQFVAMFLKAYFWVFVAMWIRATLPRVRVDQLMSMCWKYMVPMGMVNTIGTAAYMVALPESHLVVRLALLAVVLVVLVRFAMRVRFHHRRARGFAATAA